MATRRKNATALRVVEDTSLVHVPRTPITTREEFMERLDIAMQRVKSQEGVIGLGALECKIEDGVRYILRARHRKDDRMFSPENEQMLTQIVAEEMVGWRFIPEHEASHADRTGRWVTWENIGCELAWYFAAVPRSGAAEALRRALIARVKERAATIETEPDLRELGEMVATARGTMLTLVDVDAGGGKPPVPSPWLSSIIGNANPSYASASLADVVPSPAMPIAGAMPGAGPERPETFASTLLREVVGGKKTQPQETTEELLNAAKEAKAQGLDDVHEALLARVRKRMGLAEEPPALPSGQPPPPPSPTPKVTRKKRRS